MPTFLLIAGLLGAPPDQGRIVAAAGPWTVTFDGARAWTIHHLDYDGRTVSHGNGFHGAVIATGIPKTEGNTSSFVGTGHTEGGQEQVEAVTLSLDGNPVELEIGRRYEGAQFSLTKRSMIDRLRHHAEITVTAERIVEHHRFEATAEQPLQLVYAFMHCWQPTFTQWAADTADGERIEGALKSDGDFEVKRDVAWSAIYDPAAKLGMVTSYPEPYRAQNGGVGTEYWDLERYHKQYLFVRGRGALPAGTVLDYTLCLQAFRADEDGWADRAAALANSAFGDRAD